MCIRDRYTMIPMNLLSFYKLCYPIDFSKFERAKDFPLLLEDKLLRFFYFFIGLYYAFDIVMRYLLKQLTSTSCDIISTFHHIASLPVIYSMYRLNYLPGVISLPCTFHAVICAIRNSPILDYIYTIFLLFCQYATFQQPFAKIKEYRRLRKTLWFLLTSVFLMGLYSC
eukprot:TRINITY_DN7346_c0_g1_i4.p1 TRINITY_DN7346_c0_g1~~TRINITY_DN7346_c0_g1_i4.p1  ORF type:complete len:189 (+),score=27.02 TRINITY_DN7346_c0_g1_i4:61-567(+)